MRIQTYLWMRSLCISATKATSIRQIRRIEQVIPMHCLNPSREKFKTGSVQPWKTLKVFQIWFKSNHQSKTVKTVTNNLTMEVTIQSFLSTISKSDTLRLSRGRPTKIQRRCQNNATTRQGRNTTMTWWLRRAAEIVNLSSYPLVVGEMAEALLSVRDRAWVMRHNLLTLASKWVKSSRCWIP